MQERSDFFVYQVDTRTGAAMQLATIPQSLQQLEVSAVTAGTLLVMQHNDDAPFLLRFISTAGHNVSKVVTCPRDPGICAGFSTPVLLPDNSVAMTMMWTPPRECPTCPLQNPSLECVNCCARAMLHSLSAPPPSLRVCSWNLEQQIGCGWFFSPSFAKPPFQPTMTGAVVVDGTYYFLVHMTDGSGDKLASYGLKLAPPSVANVTFPDTPYQGTFFAAATCVE